MTLLDIVGEPLLVRRRKRAQVRTERVAELLKLVGLRPSTCGVIPTRSRAVSASASA
jgi:ABC-type glutathione transport system ATPase component